MPEHYPMSARVWNRVWMRVKDRVDAGVAGSATPCIVENLWNRLWDRVDNSLRNRVEMCVRGKDA